MLPKLRQIKFDKYKIGKSKKELDIQSMLNI